MLRKFKGVADWDFVICALAQMKSREKYLRVGIISITRGYSSRAIKCAGSYSCCCAIGCEKQKTRLLLMESIAIDLLDFQSLKINN